MRHPHTGPVTLVFPVDIERGKERVSTRHRSEHQDSELHAELGDLRKTKRKKGEKKVRNIKEWNE